MRRLHNCYGNIFFRFVSLNLIHLIECTCSILFAYSDVNKSNTRIYVSTIVYNINKHKKNSSAHTQTHLQCSKVNTQQCTIKLGFHSIFYCILQSFYYVDYSSSLWLSMWCVQTVLRRIKSVVEKKQFGFYPYTKLFPCSFFRRAKSVIFTERNHVVLLCIAGSIIVISNTKSNKRGKC